MKAGESARVSGRLGEVRAEQALTEAGMRIRTHNYVAPGAEIDLIAEDGRCIVFVEVKERRSGEAARVYVTPAKQKRICAAALRYMMKEGLMDRQARFDVVEIQQGQLTHIRDAFPYQGPAF